MSESVSNGWDEETDDGEGLTAGDLFERLKEADDTPNAEAGKEYTELIDGEPEDIIATADESETTPHPHEELLDDSEALEDLLLSERTKEMGFLWVDADQDDGETGNGEDVETPPLENLDVDFDQITDNEMPGEGIETGQVGETQDKSGTRPPLPLLEEDPEAIDISNSGTDQDRKAETDPEPSILKHFLHLLRRLY